jgi:hypothetical protein
MKLSIEDLKTKYVNLINRTKVYLDGKEIKYCIEASDKDGYAIYYKSKNGKVEYGDKFLTETAYGKVEFKYVNNGGPGISEEEWNKLMEEKRNE